MKNTIVILLLSIVSISHLASQNISESLLDFKESYNPLFAKESAVISMNFVKSYDLGQSDTTYKFMIGVMNNNIEKDNFTLGLTLFNSGNRWVSGSNTYKINRSQDQSVMDYEAFMELYDCMSKVHYFISKKATFKGDKKNMVATCGVGNVTFGGEYSPETNYVDSSATFYFKIGENAAYKMEKRKFEAIIKHFKEIKLLWESKK